MLKVHQVSAKQTDERLSDISLTVGSGELVAVLGPEYSGKDLLGQVVAGMWPTSSGVISINHYFLNRQSLKAKRQIGYVGHQTFLPMALTGFEYLDLVGSVYRLAPKERLKQIQQLIEDLDFNGQAYTPLERVSPATLQKVALAAAFIHEPTVLILNEPLQQLDYAGQNQALELINTAIKNGAAIILITNDLPLASQLADQLILMSNGEVVASGTLKQLINQTKPDHHDLAGVYEAIYQ